MEPQANEASVEADGRSWSMPSTEAWPKVATGGYAEVVTRPKAFRHKDLEKPSGLWFDL
jgi:hypothetical protein